jgi:hypothetical protein
MHMQVSQDEEWVRSHDDLAALPLAAAVAHAITTLATETR